MKKDFKYRHQERYKGVKIDIVANTKADLDEKIYKKKYAIDSGEYVTAHAETTVSAWSKKWLETYKKGHVAEKNYKNYESNIRLHVNPIIGAKKLTEVRQYDLQELLNGLAGKSTSHISHVKDCLTGMFRSAKKNGLIRENPAEDLTLPSGTYKGHRQLTDDEVALFFAACENSNYGDLFLFEYYTGLRPSETVSLTAADVDVKGRLITVIASKTESGKRVVPVPEPLVPILERITAGKARNEYLFTTAKGKKLTTSYLDHRWDALLNQMDIAAGAPVENNQVQEQRVDHTLTLYDLRHTYCTNLERAKVPINVAKRLMGHSSVEITARIYTHASNDVLEDAAKSINGFFGYAPKEEKQEENQNE